MNHDHTLDDSLTEISILISHREAGKTTMTFNVYNKHHNASEAPRIILNNFYDKHGDKARDNLLRVFTALN